MAHSRIWLVDEVKADMTVEVIRLDETFDTGGA